MTNWRGGTDPSSLSSSSVEIELKDYSPSAMSQQYPLLSTLRDDTTTTSAVTNTVPSTANGGSSSSLDRNSIGKAPNQTNKSTSERVKFTVSYQNQQRTVILGGNFSDSKKIEKLIRNAFPDLKNDNRLKSKELCLFVDGHVLYYPIDTIEIDEIKEAKSIEVRVLDSMSEKSSDSEEILGILAGSSSNVDTTGQSPGMGHLLTNVSVSNSLVNNSTTPTTIASSTHLYGRTTSKNSSIHSNNNNLNNNNSSSVDIFFHHAHPHQHSSHNHAQYPVTNDRDTINSLNNSSMMGHGQHMDFSMMSPIHLQQTTHPAMRIDTGIHENGNDLGGDHIMNDMGSYDHRGSSGPNNVSTVGHSSFIPSNNSNIDVISGTHSSPSFMMFAAQEGNHSQNNQQVLQGVPNSDNYNDGTENMAETIPPSQGDSEANSVVDGRKRNRGQPRRKTYHKEEKLLIMWMKDHHISVEQIIQMTTVSKSNIDKWCAAKMRKQILEKYSQENPNCVISTALYLAGKLHFYHDISQPSLVAILDKLHELQPEQLNIVIPIMLLERYDLHYPVKTRTIGMLATAQIMVDQNSDSEDEIEELQGKIIN